MDRGIKSLSEYQLMELQASFKALCSDTYVNLTTGMTGYLWRQQNLVSQMKSKSTKFIDTRRLPIERLLGWCAAKRIEIQQYIAQKNPACTPGGLRFIHCPRT
ncbi:hypothetical protein PsorP6_006675 [Peronosclerospora sorghi]|uniref:Uncharacterized protein n=1 Tax=Peronosclerospora sorghi TaxID=230839 RepID=A0ACC0W2U5_9STRA|nr:hypothetical protein PsorP6_006675 [Peronosclerospora sorghi]